MSDIPRAAAIRGKTIRYVWLDGPTKGKAYEHVFHPDGTVEWRDATPVAAGAGTKPAATAGKGTEEPVPYAAMEAAPDVYAVSYLSKAGYTLTVVLDFKTRKMVGVASGGTTWAPVTGRFEMVS
jgi:hypothetical protein